MAMEAIGDLMGRIKEQAQNATNGSSANTLDTGKTPKYVNSLDDGSNKNTLDTGSGRSDGAEQTDAFSKIANGIKNALEWASNLPSSGAGMSPSYDPDVSHSSGKFGSTSGTTINDNRKSHSSGKFDGTGGTTVGESGISHSSGKIDSAPLPSKEAAIAGTVGKGTTIGDNGYSHSHSSGKIDTVSLPSKENAVSESGKKKIDPNDNTLDTGSGDKSLADAKKAAKEKAAKGSKADDSIFTGTPYSPSTDTTLPGDTTLNSGSEGDADLIDKLADWLAGLTPTGDNTGSGGGGTGTPGAGSGSSDYPGTATPGSGFTYGDTPSGGSTPSGSGTTPSVDIQAIIDAYKKADEDARNFKLDTGTPTDFRAIIDAYNKANADAQGYRLDTGTPTDYQKIVDAYKQANEAAKNYRIDFNDTGRNSRIF